MLQLDTRLPLGVQPFDLGAVQRNTLAAMQQRAAEQEMDNRNALATAMQTYGQGVLSPDAGKRTASIAGLAAAGPAGFQAALPLMQQEQQRLRPMTADEARAAGLRPGTVAMVNGLGVPQILQAPDTPSAERQAYDERTARFQAGLQAGNRAPVPIFDPQSPSGFRYARPGEVVGQPAPAPEGYRQPVMPFGSGSGGAALAFIEQLAPAVRAGTANPEQVRRYLSAVTEYQQERIGADGTRVVPRLPPYAPGAPDVLQLYPGVMPAAPAQPPPAAPEPQAAPSNQQGVPIGTTGMSAAPPPATNELQPNPLPGAAGGRAAVPQAAPSTNVTQMLENVEGLRRAQRALELATTRPESFGLWQGAANMFPGTLERLDPGGVETRAMAADLGSLVVNQRSGAAVTAAEFPRLRPFIPQVGDPPEVVQTKLRRFADEYRAIIRDQYDAFGPRSGFRPLPVVEEALRGERPASANQPGVPRVGEVRDGWRFRGGNPADRNSWERAQ